MLLALEQIFGGVLPKGSLTHSFTYDAVGNLRVLTDAKSQKAATRDSVTKPAPIICVHLRPSAGRSSSGEGVARRFSQIGITVRFATESVSDLDWIQCPI